MSRVAAVLVAVLLVGGCGEPTVAIDIPPRTAGDVIVDQAGILGQSGLATILAGMPADVVALTFESDRASLGEAHRGGLALLEAWDADVVLVAVARPGDFTSGHPDRRRFFGVFPADRFRVPASVRERIVEELVPPLAADNEWVEVFMIAAREVEAALE